MEVGGFTEEEAEAKLDGPKTITYERAFPAFNGGWTGSHSGI
jgi:hypothetical protein